MWLHAELSKQLIYSSYIQSMIQGYMNFSVSILLAVYYVRKSLRHQLLLVFCEHFDREDHHKCNGSVFSPVPIRMSHILDKDKRQIK